MAGAQRLVRGSEFTPSKPDKRQRLGPNGAGSLLGVVELPSRPISEYTVGRWLSAVEGLESGGSFRDAADLTRAAITQSGFTSGVLDTITGGTLGLPRNVVVEPGEERIKLALEGRQGRGGDLDRLEPRAEAKQIMAWGVTLGIGLGQLLQPDHSGPLHDPPSPSGPLPIDGQYGGGMASMAVRRAGENRCPSLLAWDPRWLRFQWWDRRLFLMTSNGEIEIHPGDGEWFVYTPHGASYPWRYGAWIYLTLAFVIGRDAVFDRARHMQMAPPVRVGKVPLGTSDPQRRKYAKQIEDMKHFAWFVLPPGLEYDVVESTTSGQVDTIYASAISYSERQVAIGLTGNEVMVEGSKGFGTADIFARVTATKRAFYALTWEETERAQLLPWYMWENYGPDASVPSIVRQTDPPEDQDARLERVAKFGAALTSVRKGLDDVGGELVFSSVIEMAQAVGLRVKEKEKTTGAPAGTHIEVTPSAMEAVVTGGELRGQEALGPFGDEQTVAELLGHGPAAEAAPPPGEGTP